MNLFELFAKVSLDTTEYEREVGNVTKSGESLGSKLKSGLATAGSIAAKGIGLVAGAATAAGGALLALEANTEEYRVAQGKLNTAFEAAGYSTESAKQAYTDFYKILGDTDTATEASQLLAKLSENEQDMTTWTRAAAGVWGTFGDSLPIEGLIESANETAKVGQVTGSLADALNWAGISEDDFNAKLAACSSESERNKLIMDTLSGTYDDAADAFYRNNEAIIAAREAQAKMDESLGKLGESVSNVKTRLMGEFLPSIAAVAEGLAGMLSGTEGAEEKFSTAIGGLINTAVASLPEFLNFGIQILSSILMGIVQNIPTLLTAIPQIIQSLVVSFETMWPTIQTVGTQLLSTIANGIMNGIPVLAESAVSMMSTFGQYIRDNLPTLISVAAEFVLSFSSSIRENAGLLIDGALGLIQSLASGIIASLPTLIETVPQIVTNIAGIINDNAPKLVETAFSIIGQLAMGLIQAIPTLVANIPQIIQAIVAVFTAYNWLDLGRTIITALKNGMIAMVGAVQGAAGNILNAINNTLKSLPSNLLNLGKQGIQGLINGIKSLIGSISSVMSTVANTILNGLKSLPGEMINIAKQIINGLINGIKSGISGVASAIGDMASSAINKAKSALGIASPSKVFTEIGKYTALGFEKGWSKESENIKSMVDGDLKFDTASVDFSSSGLGVSSAGIVNGLSNVQQSGGTYTFNLILPDGTNLASYMLKPLVDYARANGTPILNPT